MKTRIITLSALLWLVPAVTQANQDPLASAKSLYESASYEAALTELNAINSAEYLDVVDTYRALCLLGLGRTSEAERALEVLVARKPLLTLSETEYSPRLIALFREVRRRTLPAAVQQHYAVARTDYENKHYEAAAAGFKLVLQLIAEVDVKDQTAKLADIKELAGGFLTLAETKVVAQAAPTPVAQVPPPPAPTAPAASVPGPAAAAKSPVAAQAGPAVATKAPLATPPVPAAATKAPVAAPPVLYTLMDADVTPPVALEQQVPAWRFGSNLPDRAFRGRLEVVITETGTVEAVALQQPIWPAYDAVLLQAARKWRYQPALRDGKPVRFRRVLDINLDPRTQPSR